MKFTVSGSLLRMIGGMRRDLMTASICDQAIMQANDSFAARAFEKARNKAMDHAGKGPAQHRKTKTKGHTHMLKIALANALGMLNK
jgi:hypothetical protein